MGDEAPEPTRSNVVRLHAAAPPGPELSALLDQVYRVALGMAALAVTAATAAVAQTLGTQPVEEVETDEEPEPVRGLPLLVGAGLGMALGVGRWSVRAASNIGRAVTPIASFAASPTLVRRRLGGLEERLAGLNARWGAERPEHEAAADEFLRRLVPQVVNAALDQLDLTQVVLERVDLDRVVEAVDVDAAAERVDVDRIVARVDLDRVLERIDLDEIAARIDIERLLERIDLNGIVDRVDLDRAVARVDLDMVAAGLDVDAVAARLDLDAVVDRMDLVRIAQEVLDALDLPQIIRDSTGSMTAETIDGIRYQSMKADRILSRLVDSVVRRGRERDLDAAQAPEGTDEAAVDGEDASGTADR